jgi:cytochrome c oxidase cbb3-type subunit 3
MADFVSGFWTWFIAIPTLAGIIGLIWFTYRYSAGHAPGQKVETMGHVWDENLAEYNNPLPRWWLNLFYITLFFGLGYLLYYPGLGTFEGLGKWTQQGQYDAEIETAKAKYDPIYDKYLAQDLAAVAADGEALTIGKRLFSTYCTQCHGADARGARGFPNLADNDWLYGGEPAKIKETIMGGRQGMMPPWEPVIGAEGAVAAAEYVLSLTGKSTDTAAAAKGKELFDKNCAACHGADGKGNQMLGAPNLTDDIWLFGGTPERVHETVLKGRQGRMPAHQEFLGEAKVHLLAAYVYSLSQGGSSK